MIALFLILGMWIVYGLWKMLFDVPAPARKVDDAEVKTLLNLPDQRTRRKWLRNQASGNKR